jgi:hypothetical protein
MRKFVGGTLKQKLIVFHDKTDDPEHAPRTIKY